MKRVPQKELLDYTAGADFGIIPYPAIDLNTKYCTPNKMFEFVSAEIPIIANKDLITVANFLKKYNTERVALDYMEKREKLFTSPQPSPLEEREFI